MCVYAFTTFVLSKRSPPTTFEQACGTHHDAQTDTKGVAVMFFDRNELGNKGLWHKIFVQKYKVCEPLTTIWEEMKIKMLAVGVPGIGWETKMKEPEPDNCPTHRAMTGVGSG